MNRRARLQEMALGDTNAVPSGPGHRSQGCAPHPSFVSSAQVYKAVLAHPGWLQTLSPLLHGHGRMQLREAVTGDVGGCWWQCLAAIPAAMSWDAAGRGPVPCSRPSPCRGPAQSNEHEQRLQRLRAELEAERRRSHELHRHFVAEKHGLKEKVERDRQLLAQWLHARWKQRQAQELQRLQELNWWQQSVEICQLLCSKEAELHELQEELEQQCSDAVRQVQHLQQQLAKELGRGAWASSEAHGKLQGVLRKLHREINGEQDAHVCRLQDKQLLQRRLFLKHILEQSESKQTASCHEARAKATARHCLQTLPGTGAIGLCSLESLTAPSSRDGEGQRKTQQSFRDACLQEEGNSVEVLLEAAGQDSVPQGWGCPPQGRAGSGRSVAEVGVQTVGQQDDCLPGGSHSRLLEQNGHLQSALKELQR